MAENKNANIINKNPQRKKWKNERDRKKKRMMDRYQVKRQRIEKLHEINRLGKIMKIL